MVAIICLQGCYLGGEAYDGKYVKSHVPKEFISAATTVYTLDWVVQHMVQNNLEKLWLEGYPDDVLRSEWKYYLNKLSRGQVYRRRLKQSVLNAERSSRRISR